MRESYQLLEPETFLDHSSNQPADVRARTSPIVWLNLVCLDAPIVAVTWQWLFAQSFHVSLANGTRVGLFLTAWLIYLADRLADTWKIQADQPLSQRQRFCQRHQIAFFVSIALLAVINLWVIFRMLDRATIEIGSFLGAASIIYLSINYWLGRIWRFIPAKEICIGSLFALGTAAALFTQLDFLAAFATTFFLFAALCSLNCIGIAIWERDLDRAQHKDSIATRLSHHLRSGYRSIAYALAVLTVGIAVWAKGPAQATVCIGMSAALLGMLDSLGERISRDERTALADLMLLTPLLFLLLRA